MPGVSNASGDEVTPAMGSFPNQVPVTIALEWAMSSEYTRLGLHYQLGRYFLGELAYQLSTAL